MMWLRDAIVVLFNASVWEAGYRREIPLADMPTLGTWMSMGWPPAPSHRARQAVDDIIRDLADRRGLKWEWWRIDETVRDDIRDAWTAIIDRHLQGI